MKTKTSKKLTLNKETIKNLSRVEGKNILGGAAIKPGWPKASNDGTYCVC